jgi:hypothetical protein
MTTILAAVPLYPLVTPQEISFAGIAPSYAAAPSGLSWWNPGGTLIHVKNGGGASTDVTLKRQGNLADVIFTVAAGAERFIGPFPRVDSCPISQANDADDRNRSVPRDGRGGLHTDYTNASFSVTSGVTYALLSTPLLGALYRDQNIGFGEVTVFAGTTALVAQTLDPQTATNPSYVAAVAGGHHVSATGGNKGVCPTPTDFYHCKNTSGSPITITPNLRGVWGGVMGIDFGPLEAFPFTINLPAGSERMFTLPPMNNWVSQAFYGAPQRYGVLTYSATAGVTIGYFFAAKNVSSGGPIGI